MAKLVFYRSINGYTADIIPFYDNGKFHLFYLHDYRNHTLHGEGTPWFHLSTSNFIDYQEHNEAIARGKVDEQDLYVFTGCVIKVDKLYHIFYTGHNPHLKKEGKPEQAIMHATSNDLIEWTKHEEDTFFALSGEYEVNDWRDPFVFYNEEEKQYWMLLAARKKEGPATRRGLTAKCVSTDLKNWKVVEPLWEPNYHYTHECPDLFFINGWWYLIYSEFSFQRLTRYRMARSLKGPWISPKDDSFDGRAYYAAKSYSDGDKRYLFGWVPTKEKENDYQPWQWGGNLLVHEIFQLKNGQLGQKAPLSVKEYFSYKTIYEDKLIKVDGLAKCSFYDIDIKLPNRYHIKVDIIVDKLTTRAGIALRHNNDKDQSYVYFLDVAKQMVYFDLFPNEPWLSANFLGVNRPLTIKKNKIISLEIFVEEDVCTLYVNNQIALSSRMYENKGFPISLIAIDGIVKFKNLKITTSKE